MNSNRLSILSLKAAHDGTIAHLKNSKLHFSHEAEKDSYHRYTSIHASGIADALMKCDDVPDVIALSGWIKFIRSEEAITQIGTGYEGFGKESIQVRKANVLGKSAHFFSSSHERSHIMCSYGMSPFEQGQPCYELIWEGTFGAFYEIDKNVRIKKLGTVIREPGGKYAFLYGLATTNPREEGSESNAGKLMALAGFSNRSPLTEEERKTSEYILDHPNIWSLRKRDMSWSPYYNVGVESDQFKQLAGKFTDKIFDSFYEFAKKHCTKRYPLLISGGCGLNCEWNSKWKDSGIFSEVFVPPVTNDTGSAIGTAIDAQHYFTGSAKISWDVYCGPEFVGATKPMKLPDYEVTRLNPEYLANLLAKDRIFALVQGNCEIGPRALGNRSIIAAPFKKETHTRLNAIKKRESYRPIAPLCLEDDTSEHFEWSGPSPFMLFFQKVKSTELKAITHVDQTARLQTVSKKSNKGLFAILTAFKNLTGYGVLCNTSLNFNGCGFINNFHDLLYFSNETDIDGFIVEDKLYLKKKSRM